MSVDNSEIEKAFQKAVKRVTKSKKNNTSNDIKLSLYGAYKQALCGDNMAPEPYNLFGLSEAHHKWLAWNKFKKWSSVNSMQFYIDLVNKEKL